MVYIIGIAGGSGSGKTCFAEKVLKHVPDNIAIIHMDAYYKNNHPEHILTSKGRQNFDHPDAFDWELLTQHIHQLKNGKNIQSPTYDFATSSRTNTTIEVGPAQVIIFEGIFTLYNEAIRNMLDIKCFLHVDSDIRFTRRLHRDVQERSRSLESVIDQYYDTVRPMYQKYLDPQRQYADFIVGEETDTAASILSAKIIQLLKITNNTTLSGPLASI